MSLERIDASRLASRLREDDRPWDGAASSCRIACSAPVRVVDARRRQPRAPLVVVDLARQQAEQPSPGQPFLARLVVEQVGVDRVHPIAVAIEHAVERLDLVESEPPRQRPQAPRAGREAVRLLALRRLQAVLDVAQEDVRGGEVFLYLGIDEVVDAELIEGGQRVSGPQRRLLAAVDQLEHLREQLDLADAAAALLDVEVEVAVARMFPVGPRLVARELLDRGVIQVLAIDERRDHVDEPPAEFEVAGDRPRLEEREPLERLPEALVVLRRLLQGVDERAAAAHRPQAHVDAVQIALSRVLGQQRGEAPSELLVASVGRTGASSAEAS